MASRSLRQSVRKILPRQSETRNSFDVSGCEEMEVRGCGKGITYAVGWGLEESGEPLGEGEGEGGAEERWG